MTERDRLILKYAPIMREALDARLKNGALYGMYLRDDLHSEGHIRLIMLIDDFLAKNKKFNGHFDNTIRIISRSVISNVYRSDTRANVKMKTPPPPNRFFSLLLEKPDLAEELGQSVESMLLAACDSQEDAKILDWLKAGIPKGDLAAELGLTRQSLGRRIDRIYRKFKQIQNDRHF